MKMYPSLMSQIPKKRANNENILIQKMAPAELYCAIYYACNIVYLCFLSYKQHLSAAFHSLPITEFSAYSHFPGLLFFPINRCI